MSEDWRIIPTYPDYEINMTTHDVRDRATRQIVPIKTNRDRFYVSIRDAAGKLRVAHISRILGLVLYGPLESGIVIRHLNDVKTDNRLENLAPGTARDNARDRTRNGRTRHLAHPNCVHPNTPEARLSCKYRQHVIWDT